MEFKKNIYNYKILVDSINTYNTEYNKKIELIQKSNCYKITWDNKDFFEISNIYIFLYNENL